jgi:signal transduction histidine kinase/CheY-like chemotaxis protein
VQQAGAEMGKNKHNLNIKNKILRVLYNFQYVIVVLIVLVLLSSTLYFYQSLKEKLFAERQSHLIELTQKVSEIIDAKIDEDQNRTDSAKSLLEHMADKGDEDLQSVLADISELLELEEGVIFAIDDWGKYYSSEQKTGYWENLKDLAVQNVRPQVRELDVFGENQACMVFFRQLDEPKIMKDKEDSITYVAVAIPMSVMEDAFSMSVFDNECYTYLVDKNGRRLYKRNMQESLIQNVNVLAALEEEEFLMGGDFENLTQAMENRDALCLEFKFNEQKENYFVSTVPISDSDWTVFMFVPTKIIGAYTNSVLNMVIKYIVGIAIVFCIICTVMIYLATVEKGNKVLMRQQEENNKLLAEAAQEARKSNSAKSEFLSRMSHDIRTPINGIIGMTDIAIKNADNQEKVKDCLGKVRKASEHLMMLVNDVLDMSSIESGNLVIAHEHMDIRKLIENCVSIIEGQLVAKDIEFKQEIADLKHPFLFGDELHLQQVFINILGNAIKFTHEGGSITMRVTELSAEDDKALYRFEFIDTGIGMSEAFQTKVFEKFAQEHGENRTNYTGTGLGMAITKQFVEKMGGTIFVQSTQGKGSTFTVELAFEIDTENQGKMQEYESWSLEGLRVLLVEDNELNMEIAKEILEDEGMTVATAENGEIAVQLFNESAEGTYDVILMDVMMPVMNGYDAARNIRNSNHPQAKRIPIIAMTANAYAQDVQASFDAGMDAHIAKPVDRKQLFSTLKRFSKADTAS